MMSLKNLSVQISLFVKIKLILIYKMFNHFTHPQTQKKLHFPAKSSFKSLMSEFKLTS